MSEPSPRPHMTLYEIDARIAACVDAETGEIIDDDALDALQMARADKLENVACWAKDEAALADALRAEAQTLLARARSAEARAERLKAYLLAALDGQRFESARARVSFRRVASVEITNIDDVPERFLELRMIQNPKKADIRDAIRAGEFVPGAQLTERLATVIK